MVELANDSRSRAAAVVEAGLSPTASQHLEDAMTAYRESLPYSSAECRWLGKISTQASLKVPGGYAAVVGRIREQGGSIISGGQLGPVDGQELIDRGWDWMRGAGAFTRNSTYEVVTRNALCRIAELFDRKTWARQLNPEVENFRV
jgi:hypothetical protein